MTERNATRIQALVAEQAAEWIIRLEDATAAEKGELAQWLTASPHNVAEFLNARATWEAMSGTALAHVPDSETLLAMLDSRSDATRPSLLTGSDVPRDGADRFAPGPAVQLREKRKTRLPMALAAGIAALAAGVGLLLGVRYLSPQHAVYQTKVGEQVTRSLPDGSTVALNTRTKVRLDWSEEHRDVYLDAGEALFQAARDPARPFRVWVAGSVIRAVGTQFNVYRATEGVTVTVIEGRVAIANPDTPTADRLQLSAGEQAHIDTVHALTTRRLPEASRAVAWQTRRLVFEGEPLSQVIAEFNRYNEKPLLLDEASLGTKRIHGIFDARERQSLIEFLETFEDLTVHERDDGLVLRRPR